MKRIVGLAMGMAVILGFGGSALADYPTGVPAVGTNNAAPVVGKSVTLTANGFCPNAVVVFTANSATLGTVTANALGTATLTIHAPTKAGPYVVTATSSGACVASATVTLDVRAKGKIPRTGTDSTASTIQLGAVAVAGGGVLIGLAALRRRRVVAA